MITSYLMGPFIEKFLWNKKETYLVYLKQNNKKQKYM